MGRHIPLQNDESFQTEDAVSPLLLPRLQAKEGVCLYQIGGSDPVEEAKKKECFVILTKPIFKALSLPVTVLIKENQIVIKTGPASFIKKARALLIGF